MSINALSRTLGTERRGLLKLLFGCVLVDSWRPSLLAAQDWEADVKGMLSEFMACQMPIEDKSPCNVFLGRALKRVFGISDFEDPSHPDSFISANQIATYVAVDNKWTSLGKASAQNNLTQAQGYSNLKKTPEEGGCGGLCSPNTWTCLYDSAWYLAGLEHVGPERSELSQLFLDDPKSSYVGGPLSKAFGANKKDQVTLYGRNF